MPVENHPIHPSTRHTNLKAGCYNRPPDPKFALTGLTFTGEVYENSMSKLCRQIGRKFNDVWVPLDECLGCNASKDLEYINISRKRIDEEFK